MKKDVLCSSVFILWLKIYTVFIRVHSVAKRNNSLKMKLTSTAKSYE